MKKIVATTGQHRAQRTGSRGVVFALVGLVAGAALVGGAQLANGAAAGSDDTGRSETCLLNASSECTLSHGFGRKPASITVTGHGPSLISVDPTSISASSYRVTVVRPNGTLYPAGQPAGMFVHYDFSAVTTPTPSPTLTPTPSPEPLRPSWQTTGTPEVTFDDEFVGETVNTDNWERGWFGEGITNGVNSNNLNCYDTNQVTQHDGMLHLTVAQRVASCNGGTRQYVSGLVNSRPRGIRGFQQQYGSFEARVCLPDADSNGQVDGFPAWWTNGPSSVSWPEHGEIDAVEGIGGRTKASLHYNATAGSSPYGSGVYSTTALIGCHNFGYSWTATDVTFYYDGIQLWTHAFRGPYPQYLILNYALRSTEQVIVGSEVTVDWVRVWQ